MNLKKLIAEFKSHVLKKGRTIVKPFASFEELYTLLLNPHFQSEINFDDNFYFFIRKKIFWILDQNIDNCTAIQFKGIKEGETNYRLITITDQILLTYFKEDLSFLELQGIVTRKDAYNALTAYCINSTKGADSKSISN